MAGCTHSSPIDEDLEPLAVSKTDKSLNSLSTTPSGRAPKYSSTHDYFMDHKNRGKCVVFNHEYFPCLNQRRGTRFDVERIIQTFGKLGFTVEVCDDYHHDAIKDKIKEVSAEDHYDNDCLVIIVLTHGEDEKRVHSYDMPYYVKDLWRPFRADKCTSLAGKPKLFFFSACRGEKLDNGVLLQTVERTETDGAKSYVIPTEADFLFGFSTPPGYVSHREPSNGTWYIRSLCSVLDKHAATCDLLDILTKTANEVTKCLVNGDKTQRKQVPEFHSRLSRRVYFKVKN